MAEDITKQKILIVDDTPDNIKVLISILRPDYRITVTTSGKEAIDIAVSKNKPDIILLDIIMPGMDGYDCCRALKSNPATESIPIIFITADLELSSEIKGLALGAVDYITKPFAPDIVKARVKTHLELAGFRASLEKKVADRTLRLEQANQQLELEKAEKKEAYDILENNERIFRSLIEHSSFAYDIIDLEGNVVYASPSLNKIFGLRPEEIIGKSVFDRIHPEDIDFALKSFAELVDNPDQAKTIEIRYKHKDRSWRNIEVSGVNMADNPAVKGIALTSHDITEKKQAEIALLESEAKYRLLAENASDLIWTRDLDFKTTFVSPSVERLTGYTPEEYLKTNIEDLLTPASLKLAATILADELAKEETGNADPDRSVTMEVESYNKDGTHRWTEVVVSFMRDKAGQATGVLGMSRDITDRKETEEKLKRSEEIFDAISKNVKDVLWIIDLNTESFTYISPSVEESWGWTVEEALKLQYEDMVTPETLNRAIKNVTEKLSQGRSEKDISRALEFEHYHKDGSTFWVESKSSFILGSDGKPMLVAGITRDITDRKKAEAALLESEVKYRTLVENSLQGVVIIQDLNLMFANRTVTEITGYSVEELRDFPPETIIELVHPDDQKTVWGRLKDRLAGESPPTNYTFRVLRKNGSIAWIEVFVSMIEYMGCPAIQATLLDVTNRIESEKALRDSEEQFRLIFENVNDEIIYTTVDGTILKVNQKAKSISGYTPEELIGKKFYNSNLIKPEDIENSIKIFKDIAAGKFVPPMEFEAFRKDKSRVFIEVNSRLITGKDDTKGILSIIRDITERKVADEQLQEYRFHLEALVKERTASLEEANTALKTLLKQGNKFQTDIEKKIQYNIKKLVTPYLSKLKKTRLDPRQEGFINIMEENLFNITSAFEYSLSTSFENLTPGEIQVANLIKQGKTTKEIADILNLSRYTINAHRANIRKKMHITNQKTNLRSFLMSYPD